MKASQLKKALAIARAAGVNLFIWGLPGTSKSAQARQFAEENDLKFYLLQLSAVDPTDIVGHFIVNKDHTETVQTPPRVFRFFKDSGGVLFLDEFNTSSTDVLAVALKLLDEKRLGEYVLHKDVQIVAAGNDTEYNASANELSLSILTRFVHVEIEPAFEDLLFYLENNSIKQTLYSFDTEKFNQVFKLLVQRCVEKRYSVTENMSQHKGALNFRTLEYAARVASVFVHNKLMHEKALLLEMLLGTVGEVSYDFVQVIEERTKDWPIHDIINKHKIFFSDKLNDTERLAFLRSAIIAENDSNVLEELYDILKKYKNEFPQIFASASVQLAERIQDINVLIDLINNKNN
jgi:hypothetical protein